MENDDAQNKRPPDDNDMEIDKVVERNIDHEYCITYTIKRKIFGDIALMRDEFERVFGKDLAQRLRKQGFVNPEESLFANFVGEAADMNDGKYEYRFYFQKLGEHSFQEKGIIVYDQKVVQEFEDFLGILVRVNKPLDIDTNENATRILFRKHGFIRSEIYRKGWSNDEGILRSDCKVLVLVFSTPRGVVEYKISVYLQSMEWEVKENVDKLLRQIREREPRNTSQCSQFEVQLGASGLT